MQHVASMRRATVDADAVELARIKKATKVLTLHDGSSELFKSRNLPEARPNVQMTCPQVVFGLVTSDVLMHLAGAEAQRGPGADRMAALAGHLVAQQRCAGPPLPHAHAELCRRAKQVPRSSYRAVRSYYPLFPPALGTFLDTSLGAALGMPVTPDVLLLPSNLAPFAKLAPVCAGEDGHKVSRT